VSQLALLSPSERRHLLQDFNPPQNWKETWSETGTSAAATLQARFERQVAKSPEHTALVCGEQRLSYRE